MSYKDLKEIISLSCVTLEFVMNATFFKFFSCNLYVGFSLNLSNAIGNSGGGDSLLDN